MKRNFLLNAYEINQPVKGPTKFTYSRSGYGTVSSIFSLAQGKFKVKMLTKRKTILSLYYHLYHFFLS